MFDRRPVAAACQQGGGNRAQTGVVRQYAVRGGAGGEVTLQKGARGRADDKLVGLGWAGPLGG